ncbi:ParB/RepB/Spo0J family partition protein [Roseitranquillus sediminis]|uniref:ParB/RepB/Spo0J family partition protein n=1 Tax=Roseitranquillus sediminis TaxID=2809051 RepID=UPI001D0CD4F1|nr:ParB N-terminal domain-containing protein [Roseitranquillus sediminis]MBM9593914.1 ParB N-terminal domain-containing protein [Roseitranquillus sediminis]
MARKRLTPAIFAEPEAAPETKAMGLARTVTRGRPPIARVAGEAAAEAALAELSSEFEAARREGRFIQQIPLDAIEAEHLVRDRLSADGEEMATLKASIAARGQQTPIEVVELSEGRFGLISGWRRLTALRALRDETGDPRFERVEAILRRPEGAAEAYQAMVDENEIRVGLSHWERARVAAKAAELGLYPTARHAVRALFATASRPKRSKIGSFLTLYQALDGALRFPAALPERLGLDLAKSLDADAGLAARLRTALEATASADAAAEQAALARVLRKPPTAPARPEPGVRLSRKGHRIVLEGAGVDEALARDLEAWLAQRNA